MYEPFDKFNTVIEKDADPRIDTNWFLIPTSSLLMSLAAYMILVTLVLPKFMENRKAYQLKNVLIAYNAVQVVVNTYLFYLATDVWFGTKQYNFWKCNSVDMTSGSNATKCINAIYLYFLSKYTDFFDTFFFILRKKTNQVSFLHVYHHVSTPAFTWFVLRFYPGGSFMLFMLLNTFVHIVMYTYYMLAAMGPDIQKYLWWKKYITTIQLAQFSIAMVHIVAVILSKECNIPKVVMVIYSFNGILFFWLFGKFYIQSYTKSYKKETHVQNHNSSNSTFKKEVSNTSSIPGSQNELNNVKQRILL